MSFQTQPSPVHASALGFQGHECTGIGCVAGLGLALRSGRVGWGSAAGPEKKGGRERLDGWSLTVTE